MDRKEGPCFSRADVEVTESKLVYQGFFNMRRYRLRHRLVEGGWSKLLERECFDRGPSVGVLLYDPYKDVVVLGEQFRIGALEANEGPWQLEIVAGIVEAGETPEDVVHREAIEEAGSDVLALEYIYEYYPSPGGSNEKFYLFCGGIDSSNVGGVHGLAEEGEDIWVQTFPRAEAWQILQENYIHNAATIIALQWLQMNYQRLQQQWQ
ncbi:MAG: ADP-ribose diphosphatase [Pseudomonadales bacterium]|nr:ADP-ribose diphosphatase [Pseudomonadales bacterium]